MKLLFALVALFVTPLAFSQQRCDQTYFNEVQAKAAVAEKAEKESVAAKWKEGIFDVYVRVIAVRPNRPYFFSNPPKDLTLTFTEPSQQEKSASFPIALNYTGVKLTPGKVIREDGWNSMKLDDEQGRLNWIPTQSEWIRVPTEMIKLENPPISENFYSFAIGLSKLLPGAKGLNRMADFYFDVEKQFDILHDLEIKQETLNTYMAAGLISPPETMSSPLRPVLRSNESQYTVLLGSHSSDYLQGSATPGRKIFVGLTGDSAIIEIKRVAQKSLAHIYTIGDEVLIGSDNLGYVRSKGKNSYEAFDVDMSLPDETQTWPMFKSPFELEPMPKKVSRFGELQPGEEALTIGGGVTFGNDTVPQSAGVGLVTEIRENGMAFVDSKSTGSYYQSFRYKKIKPVGEFCGFKAGDSVGLGGLIGPSFRTKCRGQITKIDESGFMKVQLDNSVDCKALNAVKGEYWYHAAALQR